MTFGRQWDLTQSSKNLHVAGSALLTRAPRAWRGPTGHLRTPLGLSFRHAYTRTSDFQLLVKVVLLQGKVKHEVHDLG